MLSHTAQHVALRVGAVGAARTLPGAFGEPGVLPSDVGETQIALGALGSPRLRAVVILGCLWLLWRFVAARCRSLDAPGLRQQQLQSGRRPPANARLPPSVAVAAPVPICCPSPPLLQLRCRR